MWLLDKMLRKLFKKGELTVIDHKGKAHHYGAPEPGFAPIVARLTDSGAGFAIASDPRVGAGEAYMDGRLVVEQGDIRDLLLLARYNAPFEDSSAIDARGVLRKAANLVSGKLDQINTYTVKIRFAEDLETDLKVYVAPDAESKAAIDAAHKAAADAAKAAEGNE